MLKKITHSTATSIYVLDDAYCPITQATVQLQVIDVSNYYAQIRIAYDQSDSKILI